MTSVINRFACSERKRSLRSASNYESPLNSLRKKRKVEKKSRVTSKKPDEETTEDCLRKQSPSRNSVIVITDSDNEASSRNIEDVSLSDITEHNSQQSSPQQNSERKQISCKQKNNRPSVIILENESPAIDCAQESSSNGENIAPLQADDVVELWSSLKSQQGKKCKRKISRYFFKPNTKIKKRNLFVEDARPNYSYLELLKTKKSSVHTRQRKLKCNVLATTSDCNETVVRRGRRLSRLLIPDDAKPIRKTKKTKHKKNLKYLVRDDASTRERRAECEENLSCDLAHDVVSIGETKETDCEDHSGGNSDRKLKEIVVDGCNVGFLHTNGREFSEKGIKIVLDYFESRGHAVKVFLPQHIRGRKYLFLEELYKKGTVVFTPSRHIAGKQITSYDDRYILEYATLCKGIVISSDQYRDLYVEKPAWRDTILNRLLMPTFVGDYIMFPEDPLGKSGPNLETFLRH